MLSNLLFQFGTLVFRRACRAPYNPVAVAGVGEVLLYHPGAGGAHEESQQEDEGSGSGSAAAAPDAQGGRQGGAGCGSCVFVGFETAEMVAVHYQPLLIVGSRRCKLHPGMKSLQESTRFFQSLR